VGIPRGDYLVRVNNRKVLNGVMEARAWRDARARHRAARHRQDSTSRARGRARAADAGRKDDSGDFTDGAG
jgi:histidyl-tRNA synthetase